MLRLNRLLKNSVDFVVEGARLRPLRATAARNPSFPAICAAPVIS